MDEEHLKEDERSTEKEVERCREERAVCRRTKDGMLKRMSNVVRKRQWHCEKGSRKD